MNSKCITFLQPIGEQRLQYNQTAKKKKKKAAPHFLRRDDTCTLLHFCRTRKEEVPTATHVTSRKQITFNSLVRAECGLLWKYSGVVVGGWAEEELIFSSRLFYTTPTGYWGETLGRFYLGNWGMMEFNGKNVWIPNFMSRLFPQMEQKPHSIGKEAANTSLPRLK